MNITQELLLRGIRAARSPFAGAYYSSVSKVISALGQQYVVPNVRQTVDLQMRQVREYSACINEIVRQTDAELKTAHGYVAALGQDVTRLYRHLRRTQSQPIIDAASSLSHLESVVDEPALLEQFLSAHDQQANLLMQSGDREVAERALLRKREYLVHAYAIEGLLATSLTTAKKIAVDAATYGSMLSRVSQAYFTLGCTTGNLRDIIRGLDSMQRFTGEMQTSVANALVPLNNAMLQTRPGASAGPAQIVYKLGQRSS